ncbi:MAG TPA: PEGA domain-containing protein [Kofleriaceae bacterium]|nr:PEGA domain-containing protein [Kofleriaceae bacterium]
MLAISTAATAAPRADDKYKAAAQLAADDDNEKALVLVDEGLAIAPKDLQLLQLKGNLQLKTRDYEGALATFQAYLDAGAKGANRREAQKIVTSLKAVKATFVDIAVANGPATIYLDSKTQGVFCTAQPGCKKAMLPGEYKVIAERPGFDRWTGRISIEASKTATVAITLVEKPSQLSIRVDQPAATITVDGKPYTAPLTVPGGSHAVTVALAGYATAKLDAAAHEGKPLELDVKLVPLVPLALSPATAELRVGTEPLVVEAGGVAVPAGKQTVIVHANGYRDARIEIPAERGADYKLAVTLEPIGALLALPAAARDARVLVDGKPATAANGVVEITPGARAIEVRIPGYRPLRTQGTFASDQHVELRLGALRRDSRRRTYLAGAATGVMVLAGAAFSFAALDRESAYDARARLAGVTAGDPMLASMKSSGERYSLFADLGFGLAIAGAGVTTYYFLKEGRGESHGSLQFGVGPAGAVASGRF